MHSIFSADPAPRRPIRGADTTTARFHAEQVQQEQRDAQRILALRGAHEARAQRIHDPRQCSLGLDLAGLDAQVAEAELRRDKEQQLKAGILAWQTQQLEAAGKAAEALASAKAAKLAGYVAALDAQTQERSARRQQKEGPAESAAAAGPASMRVFEGEDAGKQRRLAQQGVQVRVWADRQLAEKAAAVTARMQAERSLDADSVAQVSAANAAAEAMHAARRAAERDTAAANAAAAMAGASTRRSAVALGRAADLQAAATLTTRGAGMGLLAENVEDGFLPAQPVQPSGGTTAAGTAQSVRRVRVDHFRGSLEPPSALADELRAQQAAAKAAAEAARQRELAQEASLNAAATEAQRGARRAAAEKAAQQQAYGAALSAQMQQRETSKREAAARNRAAPSITEDFFSRIGGPSWGDEAFQKDAWAVGRIEESGPDAQGIRTVTEYRRNPTTGAKEKVVRKYKREVRVIRIPKVVEERATWKKFGKAGSQGNEGTCARSYEDIKFELPGAPAKDEMDKLLDAKSSIIVCRKCGAMGDHYTLKCPYKDINAAAMAAAGMGGGDGVASGGGGGMMMMGGGEDGEGLAMGGQGKYVPPSRRGGAASGPGGVGAGGSAAANNLIPDAECCSLRISNLGEDVDEEELREMFRPFGRIERFYLARDRETQEVKGFAFVTFSMHDEAERARVGLNGLPYMHLILRIEYAKEKRDGEGGGGGGGRGGGLANNSFVSGYGKALPQGLKGPGGK